MEELLMSYPKVQMALTILGSLVSLATIVVFVTPSKSDDKKLEDLRKNTMVSKVLDFLSKFSVISKK